MTKQEIEGRLARLRALKGSLLATYNRLLASDEAVLKEQNSLRWVMEDADREELEEFKKRYSH